MSKLIRIPLQDRAIPLLRDSLYNLSSRGGSELPHGIITLPKGYHACNHANRENKLLASYGLLLYNLYYYTTTSMV